MDTMGYTTAGVRRIKGIQHLSNWKLIVLVLLLTSYTTCDTIPSTPGSSDEPMKNCTGVNASFTLDYQVQPFIAIEWYFEDTLIAETSEESVSQDGLSISKEYTGRFHLQQTGNVDFSLANVTKADTGSYSCIVTLESTDIPKELKRELIVEEIEIGDFNVTVTDTTETCRTLKCGEPVGTQTTYVWTIKVGDTVEEEATTTTYTFDLCRKPFDCSVKCQREHDCTETPWMCFKGTTVSTDSTGRRRKRRSLDEQLFPCGDRDSGEPPDSGNPEVSSTNTTVIAVSVVIVVIVVIAIVAAVIWRKRKSSVKQGTTTTKVELSTGPEANSLVKTNHLQDKDNSEQTNLNEET